MKHYRIKVTGKVQGVFYRARTREKAAALNICGTVKNNEDGSVTIEAEGPTEQLDTLAEWCRTGPPKAQVTSVKITELPVIGMPSFEIIY